MARKDPFDLYVFEHVPDTTRRRLEGSWENFARKTWKYFEEETHFNWTKDKVFCFCCLFFCFFPFLGGEVGGN